MSISKFISKMPRQQLPSPHTHTCFRCVHVEEERVGVLSLKVHFHQENANVNAHTKLLQGHTSHKPLHACTQTPADTHVN